MATTVQAGGHTTGLATTQRADTWWVEPLITGLGFLTFALYTTWRMFEGKYYYADPYLSPMYSPLLFVAPGVAGGAPAHHAWFHGWPGWWPSFLPASPAFFILVFPLAFRLTCYYYRKFYYRAYFLTPPACAVGSLKYNPYKGETGLLVIQNIHRYTLYFAIAFIAFLAWDAILAFSKAGQIGIGLGTIILLINPILLGTYTFGCHAFRHLVGGKLDCFSCDKNTQARKGLWNQVTWLNERHQLFAWLSMIWVMGTDMYVRAVSSGAIQDLNTWGN